MQYYTPKEIAKFTGYSRDKCYKIIADLNEELKREYPNQIIFSAKIPIWYWEKKTMGIEGKKENEEVEIETRV